MKENWIRLCRWMLGVLGIGISLSACNKVYYSPVAYGSPYADYSIKGKVVDSLTGVGIPGIEVSNIDDPSKQVDTTGTDGSFSISGQEGSPFGLIVVDLKDIDSENRKYKFVRVPITLQEVKEGLGNWHEGYFEAVDVVLKMVENEKE